MTRFKGFWICMGLIVICLITLAMTSSRENAGSQSAEFTSSSEPELPPASARLYTAIHGMPPLSFDPQRPFVISDDIVDAVVFIESTGRADAVGSKGERGLMQIMEYTWKETAERTYGKEIPFDRAFEPELNIRMGTAYLEHLADQLLERQDEWRSPFLDVLLASYNAGFGAVSRADFDIASLPKPVQTYVERGSKAAFELRGNVTTESSGEAVSLDTTADSGPPVGD